jgi:hypothetical protein
MLLSEPLAVTVVDELLRCLADVRKVPLAMRAAGHTLPEILGALHNARQAGYIEETDSGKDRLTAAGITRVNQVSPPRRIRIYATGKPSPSTIRETT